MGKMIISFVLIFLFGCAAAYEKPATQTQVHSISVAKSKEEIFSVASKVLAMEGYTITASDINTGIISTAKSRKALTEADCDCGTTMGIAYIKDKRTTTEAAINIVVDGNGVFNIIASISGEYLPNNPTYGKTFECVSTGTIEQNIINKIQNHLR